MSAFVLDAVYVPAMSIDHALIVMEQGDWYSSPMAAAAVADQYKVERSSPYKVFSVTFKEM